MSRNENSVVAEFLQQLLATGPGAPAAGQKMHVLRSAVALPAAVSDPIIIELLRTMERQHQGLERAGELTAELRLKVDELIGRLWYPAIFRGHVAQPEERRVWVQTGKSERVVGLSSEVPLEGLKFGCEVMLNCQQSCVVALSNRTFPRASDIATVAEKTARGVIVRRAEDEIEVELAASLNNVDVMPGDRIFWHPSAAMAYGKLGKSATPRFSLGEVPNVALSDVGGQDENLAKLLSVLGAGMLTPKLARDYGISNRCSVLLTGPSGCGKTRMVQATVTELSRQSGRTAKIFLAKPGELEHWLVGSSELNVRTLFKSLKDAADEGSLVVLFLDEAESIGRARGNMQGLYSDKLLNALLAEIDGFAGREGVAIVATSNRPDLMDPAFLSRVSDYVLQVGRPDMIAARSIMGIHMRPEPVPYSPNGTQAMETRAQIIETGVSLLYSPNSPYREVARVKFRDGKHRVLSARDFCSGRLFEQTCRAARQYALEREQAGGPRGVRVSDMQEAIADAIDKTASSLTVHNIRHQVSDLPTDIEVVAVERLLKRVSRPHRYVIVPEDSHE